MKKILLPAGAANEGGSGHGVSYWMAFLKCPKRYQYERQETMDERSPDGAPPAKETGTLVHKLLELYYDPSLTDDHILEYDEGNDNPAWHEALRLFEAYRERYPRNELGDVLHTELGLESRDSLESFGVDKFTGKLDAIIYLDEEAVDVLTMVRPTLGVLNPGIYLVDHKTAKSNMSTLPTQVKASFQFTAYQMLYQERFPDLPIQGLIANYIFKHKNMDPDKSFRSLWVPPPSDEKKAALKETLAFAYDMKMRYGEGHANPAWCFIYAGCPYWHGFKNRAGVKGPCKGTSDVIQINKGQDRGGDSGGSEGGVSS